MVVYGTNTGAIVPAALDHKRQTPLNRHKLGQARSAFNQGSCRSRGRFTVGCIALKWLEAGVANDSFLVHASRPVIEALIRTAGRLAPSGGSCRSLVEAA